MGIFDLEKTCKCCSKLSKVSLGVAFDDGTFICGNCVERIGSAAGLSKTKTEKRREDVESVVSSDMTPKKIKAELDRYVVGQEQAKKIISVAAYNHQKRIALKDDGIQKSNVMMIGPSGAGKTYLIKTLAKILNVPLALCTATGLTESGWVGEDPSTVLESLLAVCEHNVELAERGIVFIDEIDKIAPGSSESKEKVGGKGVQQALLPIIEGAKISVPIGVGPGASKVTVDTSNILFIFGGAFPDMEQMIKKRLDGSKESGVCGFTAVSQIKEEAPKENILLHTTNEDLKEFGFIPEFLGRVPETACLEELSIETLKKILYEPEDSIVTQYKKLFRCDGVDIEFTDGALTEIANKAKSHGTGARSLRKVLEELLLDLQYEVPGSNCKKIVITEEFARGEIEKPIMEAL